MAKRSSFSSCSVRWCFSGLCWLFSQAASGAPGDGVIWGSFKSGLGEGASVVRLVSELLLLSKHTSLAVPACSDWAWRHLVLSAKLGSGLGSIYLLLPGAGSSSSLCLFQTLKTSRQNNNNKTQTNKKTQSFSRSQRKLKQTVSSLTKPRNVH